MNLIGNCREIFLGKSDKKVTTKFEGSEGCFWTYHGNSIGSGRDVKRIIIAGHCPGG